MSELDLKSVIYVGQQIRDFYSTCAMDNEAEWFDRYHAQSLLTTSQMRDLNTEEADRIFDSILLQKELDATLAVNDNRPGEKRTKL